MPCKNVTIEFVNSDRATVRGYYVALLGATPPGVATVGRETNEVARVNGRWLSAKRGVSP